MKILEFLWPKDRVDHIAEHGKDPIPQTDSIEELARFLEKLAAP